MLTEKKKETLAIYLFLTAITTVAFWQLKQCDFINFDDPTYVTQNVHILNGISKEGIRWAFTTTYALNWHPLTWISHMLDAQLFGLDPMFHHWTNLLFHIANTLLLFFVLNRMTKEVWKSAFVAALFAVHPLHVESVAWVAERKDVLSTFFWMLVMGAYVHYVDHPRPKNYLLLIALFGLGIMAKPMIVTLPFVLLLLDCWPLRRYERILSDQEILTVANGTTSDGEGEGKSGKKQTVQVQVKRELVGHLLKEKLPLFVLSAISCAITLIAQQNGGAVVSLKTVPPGIRIANALVSYATYIEKSIWPNNLALFYPYVQPPFWGILGAALGIVAVTCIIIRTSKTNQYMAVGWLWFFGTLVPVIGVLQVGAQSMADRYTYIPLIGLFIMVAWGVPEFLQGWRYRKVALFASSALVLLCFLILTWTQVGYWRNSICLYDHALKITDNNSSIHLNRGVAYGTLGNYRKAIEDFDRVIQINPKDADVYINRAVAYNFLGNQKQALEDLNNAIKFNRNYAGAFYYRAIIYDKLGDQERAIEDMKSAAKLGSQAAKNYLRSHETN